MIRALIVDDEPLAREELAALLDEAGTVEVVGEAGNGKEALLQARDLRPDVIFLDIDMPGLSGVDVSSLLPEPRPLLVFVTAHQQYALDAFDEAALDYLLKPVDPERLARTLSRIEALSPGEAEPPLERLACYQGNRVRLVSPADIDCAYVDLTGTQVRALGEELHCQFPLKTLEARLPLLRVHRQYLVNPDAIKAISPKDGGAEIETRHGALVPVSRRYLKQLRERYQLPF
ncbi:putative response regulatory protein [Marinobacterium nitratireducens]|uniref:Response regulatory protein n=1 Tax=Marinobacterium nitratireducens TaxID=518897 RepID=A0A918DSD3_9GAMM|nr:two-component system response regulator BtsR [Marinobacterium nitratireducens]GGO80415.1 putative response regulatory protein [Marinobacterium nitratireducens]